MPSTLLIRTKLSKGKYVGVPLGSGQNEPQFATGFINENGVTVISIFTVLFAIVGALALLINSAAAACCWDAITDLDAQLKYIQAAQGVIDLGEHRKVLQDQLADVRANLATLQDPKKVTALVGEVERDIVSVYLAGLRGVEGEQNELGLYATTKDGITDLGSMDADLKDIHNTQISKVNDLSYLNRSFSGPRIAACYAAIEKLEYSTLEQVKAYLDDIQDEITTNKEDEEWTDDNLKEAV